MSTDTVSPLRRRMIEDMNARKLCAGTQRGHLRGCKRRSTNRSATRHVSLCNESSSVFVAAVRSEAT